LDLFSRSFVNTTLELYNSEIIYIYMRERLTIKKKHCDGVD